MLITRLVPRALRGAAGAALLTSVAVTTAVMVPLVPASAAPSRADLALTRLKLAPGLGVPGTPITLAFGVRNLGTATSDPVTVTVTQPEQVSRTSVVLDPDSRWECDLAGRTWTCQYPALAPSEFSQGLTFTTVADAAVPGDVLTFDVAVAPSKQETSLADNTAQASTSIFDFGTLRGTLWIDTNRDGQRTPDEPVVSGDTPGLIDFFISRQGGEEGQTGATPTIQADGTYSATLEPGQYVVVVVVDRTLFGFAHGDVGDDATDSDLVDFQVEPDAIAGLSATVTVLGDEVVVDGGLVTIG